METPPSPLSSRAKPRDLQFPFPGHNGLPNHELQTKVFYNHHRALIWENRSSMYLVLFIFFGGLCVAGALNLLFQRHPINSALSLIVVMSSLAVLYLLLGAEFLAAAQVIVYSGAIMVLFTFVIMLLNAGKEERTHGSHAAYIVGIPGVAILVSLLAFIFLSARTHLAQARLGEYVVSTTDLSKVLFRDLLLPFEVTSVLILIAILGAVALASKEH